MKFTEPLKKSYEFKIIYAKGKAIASKNLVMYVLKNSKDKNYLGFSVSKKVGKSVTRSKVTRLIKENYRLKEDNIKIGYNIVIVARASSKNCTYYDINKDFIYLLKKHNIYLS